jgi:hypothetical protein
MSTFTLKLPELVQSDEFPSIAEAFGFSHWREKELVRIINTAARRTDSKSKNLKWITENDEIKTLEELVYVVYEYGKMDDLIMRTKEKEMYGQQNSIPEMLRGLLGLGGNFPNIEELMRDKSNDGNPKIVEVRSDGIFIDGKPYVRDGE